MNSFFREVDHLLLSLPMLSCMAGGAACGFLQQLSYEPVKAAGWLGARVAIVLGVVCGVPLLVYSLAKLTFAKALNMLTLNQFESLKSFEEHSELQFNITLVTVSTLPLIVFALPHVIKTAYLTYQTYQQYQAIYDEFMESDLYLTLEALYTQIQQTFNPNQASPLEEAFVAEKI